MNECILTMEEIGHVFTFLGVGMNGINYFRLIFVACSLALTNGKFVKRRNLLVDLGESFVGRKAKLSRIECKRLP
jgi:hypothetical protein